MKIKKKACLWNWASSITVFSPLHHTGSAVPSDNPLLCLAVKQRKKEYKIQMRKQSQNKKVYALYSKPVRQTGFAVEAVSGWRRLSILSLIYVWIFYHSWNPNARPRRERNFGMKNVTQHRKAEGLESVPFHSQLQKSYIKFTILKICL